MLCVAKLSLKIKLIQPKIAGFKLVNKVNFQLRSVHKY